jgi:penicillin-binding protein 2
LKPKFVWKIVDNEKNLIEEIKPEIERENFIDQKNLQIVREGMRWAVTGQNSPHASAVALSDLPVAVAAKTGTAQVSRKGCEDCYNIWISVFAPYEDPKIVLTIMLEDVRGRLSQVVVPVAKEILNWYFSQR